MEESSSCHKLEIMSVSEVVDTHHTMVHVESLIVLYINVKYSQNMWNIEKKPWDFLCEQGPKKPKLF